MSNIRFRMCKRAFKPTLRRLGVTWDAFIANILATFGSAYCDVVVKSMERDDVSFDELPAYMQEHQKELMEDFMHMTKQFSFNELPHVPQFATPEQAAAIVEAMRANRSAKDYIKSLKSLSWFFSAPA